MNGPVLVSNPNLFLCPLPRARDTFFIRKYSSILQVGTVLALRASLVTLRILLSEGNSTVGIAVYVFVLAVDMAVFIDKINGHQ
jgi:hypothetical protein